MKKSKLTLGIVATFIAASALTACNDYLSASKDGYLVTFNGYDGKTYNLITDEVYEQYRGSSSGISKFYDQILEVLIRNEFTRDEMSIETEKEFGTIETEAKNDVKSQKTTAKENAKANGTTYKKEWQAILDSNGVEDADELLQLFIYQKEKEQLEDGFYDKFEDTLRKEYLGVTAEGAAVAAQESYNGDIISKFPYHIRHILVKVEDGGSNYSTGTISKDQATKLYNVVSELSDGIQTFGQVALKNSEDGSSSKYGDVGIMTNNATADGNLSMVKEFQLGIYAYDALFNTKFVNKETVNNGLGITEEVAETIASKEYAAGTTENGSIKGLAEVPFSVFQDLKDYADVTKDPSGHELSDGNAAVYPRNILWNKYLNKHNIFIITNAARSAGTLEDDGSWKTNEDINSLDRYEVEDVPAAKDGKPGFRTFAEAGLPNLYAKDAVSELVTKDQKKVLTDEQGRVIVGVRSEYGIHFMVIQKSIYDFANTDVSLEEYYTTLTPKDENYPGAKEKNPKTTYVNYINTQDQSQLNERADEVKSAIKSFDSTYEYRLFEYLLKENDDKFDWSASKDSEGKSLKNHILDYIELQRELNKFNQEKGISRAWETYFELIQQQNYERTVNAERLVPEGCVIGFKKNSEYPAEAYEKGGACYYGK